MQCADSYSVLHKRSKMAQREHGVTSLNPIPLVQRVNTLLLHQKKQNKIDDRYT